MKTKSPASRARVSKIPPKPSSMFARAMDEISNLNSTNPGAGEDSSQRLELSPNRVDSISDPDAMVPETPMTPSDRGEDDDNDARVSTSEGDKKVLVCNGNDCTLSIRECCFPCFDDNGKFYCPSCSYKCALAEVEQVQKELMLAKENVQLARKSISLFVSGSVSEIQRETRTKESVEPVEAVTDKCATGNCGERVNVQFGDSNQHKSTVENQEEVEAVNADRLVVDKSQECEGSSVAKGDNAEQEQVVSPQHNNVVDENVNGNLGVEVGAKKAISSTRTRNAKKVAEQSKRTTDPKGPSVTDGNDSLDGVHKDSVLLRQLGRPRPEQNINDDTEMVENLRDNEEGEPSEVDSGSGSNSSHSESTESADPFAVFRYQDSVAKQCNVGRSRKSSSETALKRNDAKIVSRKSAECYKPVKRSTNPAIPDSRRRKLPWNYEEEEMLKEAVKKFSVKGRQNLSWKSILEYGCQVFNESRTPVDLKDKWRNMVKEGSKAKQR